MSTQLWRALSLAFTVAAGAVAQKTIATGWRIATGHTPPTKPESPEVGTREAVVFAALAGALLNVARVVATRQAAVYWAKRHGGEIPEALRDAF
jgi:hypothetical protein